MDVGTRLSCTTLTYRPFPPPSVRFYSTTADESIEEADDGAAQPSEAQPFADGFVVRDVPSLLRMMRFHNKHRNSREHYLASRRLYFAHRGLLAQPRHSRHRQTQFVCEEAMDAMIALHATASQYSVPQYHPPDAQHDAAGQQLAIDSGSDGWQCGWLDAIKCYCYLHSRGMEVTGIGCYNRLMECLLRADEDDDKGLSSPQRAEAAAEWLQAARSHLQRMDETGFYYNPYTHYLMALANLRRGDKQAAHQQLLGLSELVRQPQQDRTKNYHSPLLTHNHWKTLFYAFYRVRNAAACSLILDCMEIAVGKSSAILRDRAARMTDPTSPPVTVVPRPSIQTYHVSTTKKAFDLHTPLPPAPVQVREAIVRPLDVVDPVPPALADILGPYLTDYQQLIAEQSSHSADTDEEMLVAYLRQCCASEDVEGAVQCWLTLQAEGRESSSASALYLLLSVLSTSNFASAGSVASLSSPLVFVRYAERLHIQMQHALAVVDTLQSASLPLPPPLAMLMVRALAYLPMPLPSSASSVSNLNSSSHFASFPIAVFLTAEEAASRCLTLYQLCLPSSTSSHAVDSYDTQTRLLSLLVRTHVKHRQLGQQLTESLLKPEDGATHTPLDAAAYVYLIYHHINMPTPSLEAAYTLFAHLLPPVKSHDASRPPPPLAVYYMACGELQRRNASKARSLLRECLQRWSMFPSHWLLDAVVLSIGGRGVTAVDERKEEDDTAQLLSELCTWNGDAVDRELPLPMSLDAMTAWSERRVGRWFSMKKVDGALEDRVQVDRAVAEVFVRSLVHPSAPSSFSTEASASAVPLPLLTNLMVLMSTSAMLPDMLLAVLQRVLDNDDYLAHNASDSAVVSALQSETEWYALSRTLAGPLPAEVAPTESESTINQFARFKAALASRPSRSPSQSAFLRRHIASRIIRCIIYTYSYISPPSSTLLFLASLSHRLRLDLNGHPLHILLFLASVRLLPSTQLLYELVLTASSRRNTDEYGYEAGSSLVWSRTLQYAHLFYLLYISRVRGISTRENRFEFQRLLARLFDYRVERRPHRQPLSMPVVINDFLTDQVVWALLDMSLLMSSPSTLRQAVSALLLQHTPHVRQHDFPVGSAATQSICPLPRFATTLMRGMLLAARGAHAKGWIESGTRLGMYWALMYELCHRYYANHTGLTSKNKSGIFLITQRELLCRLAALSVDHNNLKPVMSLYATIMQLTAESPTAAEQLIHLPLFVVPMKAALLNGHKRKLAAVVKDLMAWEGLEHVSNEQVSSELARCRLGVLNESTMHATPKVAGVVRALIARTLIVSQRVFSTTPQPQQQQQLTRRSTEVPGQDGQQAQQRADKNSGLSPIDLLPATSALRAAIETYRAVLSSRLALTHTGLMFASELFSDIFYAHIKGKRQRAGRLQRELHGEEDDEKRAMAEDDAAHGDDDVKDGEDVEAELAARLQRLKYDETTEQDGLQTAAYDADDVQNWTSLNGTDLHSWPTDAQQESSTAVQGAVQAVAGGSAAEELSDGASTVSWADRQVADLPPLIEQLCDECVVSLVGHARTLVCSSDYKNAVQEHKTMVAARIAQLRKQQQQQQQLEHGQRVEQPRRKEFRDKVISMLSRRSSPPVVSVVGQSTSREQSSSTTREELQVSK